MKLVVGLGNPGRRYEATRHNVGYEVVEELARRHATGRPKTAFHGEVIEADLGGTRILLLEPHTYMNRSGDSVAAALNFYKLDPAALLIVCDDINLPLGKLRMRARGSSGGQKGLADVARRLATEEFARLRIGVGVVPAGWDAAKYVLGRFANDERPAIDEAIQRAADAVVVWVRQGAEAAMNQFNRDA